MPKPSTVEHGPCDLVILVALPEEFDQLFALLPGDVRPIKDSEYGGSDYAFSWHGYRCIARMVGDMGPERAGLVTDRLMARWCPQVVANIGIAASLHKDVRLADVFVAAQVDGYMANLKAVQHSDDAWQFEHRGEVFRADHALVQEAVNLPYAERTIFQTWQQAGADDLIAQVPEPARNTLTSEHLIHARPAMSAGHLASGPAVGAARAFTRWIHKRDATIKALEMEAVGLVRSATERTRPIRALVIRGISDLGDDRKSDLDAVGAGGLRRLAMRNAVRLLASLLKAETLPRTEASSAGAP